MMEFLLSLFRKNLSAPDQKLEKRINKLTYYNKIMA